MAQGGGLLVIDDAAQADALQRASAPGACAARERWLAADRASAVLFPNLTPSELQPMGGGGVGFTGACSRQDCEWVADAATEPGRPGGPPCPRWLRLAKAANTTTPLHPGRDDG